MEQKSLRVLDTNKTFFSKITSTITKMLIPTKLGINNMMISMKRNNLIKAYTNYNTSVEENDVESKEILLKKYEDAYSLYLEAIDKYIMDSVYKKVKNGTASDFEREALSKYYFIVSLKEKQYIEYKYKKQEYLLSVDYQAVLNFKKESAVEKYNKFYISKMDSLYRGLLKNYSIQLSDNISSRIDSTEDVYSKIFSALEKYVSEILPIKLRISEKEEYKNIIEDYEKYESMLVGKLDERDTIKQRVVLLDLSRELFTHSLPLTAAEHCYERLINDVKALIVKTKAVPKKEKTYELLIEVIEDYTVRLLSTKVYWDKPEKREEFKIFWGKYNEINKIEKSKEKENKKQVLFLKNELKNSKNTIAFTKDLKAKLVSMGAIKQIKNSCKTLKNSYKKVKV